MSTFLISKNNLSDLTNIEKARNNLGIGTLALQNADDVDITGGSVSVSNLVLHAENAEEGSFVVSLDSEGTLGFYKNELPDWAYKPQNEVNISQFENDLNYVETSSLANVAFSGDYNDLLNTPMNLSDYFTESEYLLRANNLSDILDVEEAKRNLGFGPFASFANSDTIVLSNLYVLNNFHFIPQRNNVEQYLNKYLKVTEYNDAANTMQTEWVDFPIAGRNGSAFGMLQLSSDYTSDDPFTAPTSKALFEAYTELNSKISTTTEQQFMNDLIDHYGLLTKNNNLKELTPQLVETKSNLKLGTLSEQNSDSVVVENLEILSDFVFSKLPFEGAFLGCRNASGEAVWQSLPTANHRLGMKGMVCVSSDIDSVPVERKSFTVPNIDSIINIYEDLLNEIDTLSNMVPIKVRDLEDWQQFCLIDDAFLNIDANRARTNLKLHPISWTGSYTSLDNTPENLSYFNNYSFLEKNNNLSDLGNVDTARHNLGLGSMSTQNSNDVNITGGTVVVNDFTVKEKFVFDKIPTLKEDTIQTHFLAAENKEGKVCWKTIQTATEELYGVVQLTHDISNSETLGKIASATAVFKVYTELNARIELISSRIDALARKLSS